MKENYYYLFSGRKPEINSKKKGKAYKLNYKTVQFDRLENAETLIKYNS